MTAIYFLWWGNLGQCVGSGAVCGTVGIYGSEWMNESIYEDSQKLQNASDCNIPAPRDSQ